MISSAKEILEYNSVHYEEEEFVLFTFFVHLTTFKVNLFPSIIAYNVDFQITLNTIANTGSTFLSDLYLATYLYVIKNIYLDFAVSQQSASHKRPRFRYLDKNGKVRG